MRNRPDSPCIGLCTTLYDTYCKGCNRHYLEVARWVEMTDEEKEAVWRRIEHEQHAHQVNRERSGDT